MSAIIDHFCPKSCTCFKMALSSSPVHPCLSILPGEARGRRPAAPARPAEGAAEGALEGALEGGAPIPRRRPPPFTITLHPIFVEAAAWLAAWLLTRPPSATSEAA